MLTPSPRSTLFPYTTLFRSGRLVVTDREGHRVYRFDAQGTRTVIAGNGTAFGGGDGQLATSTGLNEVRAVWFRSEEHTSELQSPCNLVCRLLLEKKHKKKTT